MKDLIDKFWGNYSALKIAISKGNHAKAAELDGALNVAIQEFVDWRARNMDEIICQFRFATDLVNVEAEDVGCVRRNIALIRTLIDKYVGLGIDVDVGNVTVHEVAKLPYSVLDEDAFDDDLVPIAVIKHDYTISYANHSLAAVMKSEVAMLIGNHSADIFGFKRFRTDIKARLDDSLNGAIARFTHTEDMDGETMVKIYEFSPCYAPSREFIGVLVRLSIISDRRTR